MTLFWGRDTVSTWILAVRSAGKVTIHPEMNVIPVMCANVYKREDLTHIFPRR